MVEKAQNATGSGNMKDLYDISKKVLNETVRKSLTVKAKDGKILSTVEEQLERWREHFSEVFNNNNTVDNCKKEQYSRTSGTKRISLMIVKKELLLRFPRRATWWMKSYIRSKQASDQIDPVWIRSTLSELLSSNRLSGILNSTSSSSTMKQRMHLDSSSQPRNTPKDL